MTSITRRTFLAGVAAVSTRFPQDLGSVTHTGPETGPRTALDEVRAGKPIRSLEVIDTHGHIGDTQSGAVWPRSADLLVQAMDRCGTSQIVVSPFEGILATTNEQLRSANDMCARVAIRYPRRMRFYVVLQPYLLEESRAQLERILAPRSPFCGIKLHGAVHNYPVNGPAYKIAYQFAHDHSLPVLLHLGPGADALGSIGAQYPQMKLILAHFAGGNGSILKLVREQPNFLIDTCTSSAPRQIVEHLRDTCGVEKILYGSDSAYLGMGSQIARIGYARISEQEKAQIYGKNARTVFGDRLSVGPDVHS